MLLIANAPKAHCECDASFLSFQYDTEVSVLHFLFQQCSIQCAMSSKAVLSSTPASTQSASQQMLLITIFSIIFHDFRVQHNIMNGFITKQM